MAAFRVSDLLTVLKPDTWKIDENERNSLNQTLESLHQHLKDLEQWRAQFAGQPDNSDLGDKVSSAIDSIRSGVDVVSRAISQYDSSARSVDYQQAGNELSTLQQKLNA